MYVEGTEQQQETFVLRHGNSIVPLFTGGLSLIASYVILRELVWDHQNRKGNAITRLLMSLSVTDLTFSLGTIMSTFASPAELDYLHMNVGNTASCDAQGFLLTLGFTASPMFVLAISYFYLLVIRYDYPEQALRTVEIVVHILVWVVALAVAAVPLAMGMYNNDLESCWIAESPLGCASEDSDVECDRGHGASDYAHVLAFIPLWPCMIMCSFALGCLYCTVRATETKMASYEGNGRSMVIDKGQLVNSDNIEQEVLYSSNIERKMSNSVALQAAAYISVFILTYSGHVAATLLVYLSSEWHQPVQFFAFVIAVPLQGFFNACVFCRKREMQTVEGRYFRMIFCCGCGGGEEFKGLMRDNKTSSTSTTNKATSRFFEKDDDGSESVNEWSY